MKETHAPVDNEGLIATRSFGREGYPCQKPWPKGAMVQCGDSGIVLPNGSIKQVLEGEKVGTEGICTTAFFEAFPKLPPEQHDKFSFEGKSVTLDSEGAFRQFIRGEGATITEAEEKAWEQWLLRSNCPGHELDRRGRTDGYCYCKHCAAAGLWLQPTTNCAGCGALTNWGEDSAGKMHCKDCYEKLPDDKLSPMGAKMRNMVRLMKEEGDEEEDPTEAGPPA